MTFGEALKQIRRDKEVSQRELAERVGVDFSYISKIENDRMPPPAADTIEEICEALDVSPDDLLPLTGKVPSSIKDALGSSSAALGFMREASEMGLSEEEWKELQDKLKHLRGD
jgi:transcriptional regulator with XRE-family HTH domain